MTEVAPATAAPAAQPAPMPTAITSQQAAQMLAERRANAAKPAANPVSDAARTLGQQAAKARQERQAQAAAAQESPQGEGGDVEDDSTQSNGTETLNETVNEPPTEGAAEGEGEPAETQTIDLGDGVTLTLDEVRDGVMMKADHTRKTMALAERAKAVDARESQTLAKLDKIVSTLEQKIGKPRSLSDLIKEYGRDEGLDKFAAQEEEQSRLTAAEQIRERTRASFIAKKEADRDEYLAETYNKEWADAEKRDEAYTKLTAFALKQGADAETIRRHAEVFAEPWAIKVLDMASKYVALQADKSKVTKHIAEKPKVTKPGSKISAQAGAHSALQTAQAKLKTSGQLADAVSLLRARRATRG